MDAGQPRPDKSRRARPVSSTVEPPTSDATLQTTLEENAPYVGLMTRMISWAVDFLLINVAAIITGLGVALVVAIFPITKNLQPLFAAIAGAVYVVWTAAYFVTFWSVTGQTPGSRLMQVRLVTGERGKGQTSAGIGPLDRDEPRHGAVAVGLRADPVQATGIPGLARAHPRDRGPTAVDRRCSTGTVARRRRQIPTNASSHPAVRPIRV